MKTPEELNVIMGALILTLASELNEARAACDFERKARLYRKVANTCEEIAFAQRVVEQATAGK